MELGTSQDSLAGGNKGLKVGESIILKLKKEGIVQKGRLKKLNMGPIYKLKPIQDSTLSALKSLKNSLNEALRKGKEYRETSEKKWGKSIVV